MLVLGPNAREPLQLLVRAKSGGHIRPQPRAIINLKHALAQESSPSGQRLCICGFGLEMTASLCIFSCLTHPARVCHSPFKPTFVKPAVLFGII